MMDFCYNFVLITLDRSVPKELKSLWRLSLICRDGAEIRVLIGQRLASLCHYWNVPASNLRDLLSSIRKKKIQRRVRHMPKTWTLYYLEKEDLSTLFYSVTDGLIDLDGTDHLDTCCDIVATKPLSFVQSFLEAEELKDLSYYTFTWVLCSAIRHKNVEVSEYLLLQKKVFDEDECEDILEAALEVGDWKWIEIASKTTSIQSFMLRSAVKGGHEDVIAYVSKKNKKNKPIEYLKGYILESNLDSVKRILEQYQFTLSELSDCFFLAMRTEDEAAFNYICEKAEGFRRMGNGYLQEAAKTSLSTLRCIYNMRDDWFKEELKLALFSAVFHERVENVHFLLEKGAKLEGNQQKDLLRLLSGEQD